MSTTKVGYLGMDPLSGFDFKLYTPEGENVCRLMDMEIEEDQLTCTFQQGLVKPGVLYVIGKGERGRKTAVFKNTGPYTLIAYEDLVSKEPYKQEGFYLGRAVVGLMPGRREAIIAVQAKATTPIDVEKMETYYGHYKR